MKTLHLFLSFFLIVGIVTDHGNIIISFLQVLVPTPTLTTIFVSASVIDDLNKKKRHERENGGDGDDGEKTRARTRAKEKERTNSRISTTTSVSVSARGNVDAESLAGDDNDDDEGYFNFDDDDEEDNYNYDAFGFGRYGYGSDDHEDDDELIQRPPTRVTKNKHHYHSNSNQAGAKTSNKHSSATTTLLIPPPPPTQTTATETTATTTTTEQNTSQKQPSKPNLLFIMTDQQIYHALGFIQAQRADFRDKLHVRTPNIDALAQQGVYFETAYCVSPSCGPSRASIRTGNTVQRTGILNNACFKDEVLNRMSYIRQKVHRMVSFEQILVEEQQYVAESYGKWHLPFQLYYKTGAYKNNDQTDRVISYNVYDSNNSNNTYKPGFLQYMNVKDFYYDAVKEMIKQDNLNLRYGPGDQTNYFSGLPYTPIQLDSRYGYPAKTSLSKQAGFQPWQLNPSGVCGVETVESPKYSATAVTGDYAVRALQRLAKNKSRPFSLSVNFNAPHAPIVASYEYFYYYYNQRDKLYVSPSISDTMKNSAYQFANQRHWIPKLKDAYPYDDPDKIAELTAAYYAMIEEVDVWVGNLMDVLKTEQILQNTMVIVTSDHGEMLGAHGMLNKNVLLEEATRIPLIIKFPETPPSSSSSVSSSEANNNNNTNGVGGLFSQALFESNSTTDSTSNSSMYNSNGLPTQPLSNRKSITIHDPVSQLDLYATILDFLGATTTTTDTTSSTDGTSLRRFTDQLSYNKDYDERYVVVEIDHRIPLDQSHFTDGAYGTYPNFMVRKGEWKLILTKLAKARVVDMMYNLDSDPYEMENLLGNLGQSYESDIVVGKAEHLKALLIEWMERMDGGPKKYYSDPKYNLNLGRGDLAEIRDRRTWRVVPYWESDSILSFGSMVYVPGSNSDSEGGGTVVSRYMRREYLYVGRSQIPQEEEDRTSPLQILNMTVKGKHAGYFNVYPTKGTIAKAGHVRFQVTMMSLKPMQEILMGDLDALDAWLEFRTNYHGNTTRKIQLGLEAS